MKPTFWLKRGSTGQVHLIGPRRYFKASSLFPCPSVRKAMAVITGLYSSILFTEAVRSSATLLSTLSAKI